MSSERAQRKTVESSDDRRRQSAGPPEGSGTPVACLVITSGQQVYGPNGRLGVVDEILVGATSPHDAWILVRKGEGLPADVLIPYTWVRSVDEMGIQIDATNEALLGGQEEIRAAAAASHAAGQHEHCFEGAIPVVAAAAAD